MLSAGGVQRLAAVLVGLALTACAAPTSTAPPYEGTPPAVIEGRSAPPQEPLVASERWRSPDRILTGTGSYFFLDIAIDADGTFAGEWRTYMCVAGDCSRGEGAQAAPASGTFESDGHGLIELDTAGSSPFTWEDLSDAAVARIRLSVEDLFGGSAPHRSLLCPASASQDAGCSLPEPTESPVDLPSGFPTELPFPPAGRPIEAGESNQPDVYPMSLVVEVPNASLDETVSFLEQELEASGWIVFGEDYRDPALRGPDQPDPFVVFSVDSGMWTADIFVTESSAIYRGAPVRVSYQVCIPACG